MKNSHDYFIAACEQVDEKGGADMKENFDFGAHGVTCPECGGEGMVGVANYDGDTCPVCKGSGEVEMVDCPDCLGNLSIKNIAERWKRNKYCETCKTTGKVRE